MRELSLHILDIAQNSIAAGAKHIQIVVNENENGFFVFKITDDGCGMSEKMLQKVRDPFITTRKTRKIGMGIPFMDMVTQQCGGHLDITSKLGEGTCLKAYFAKDNIDRPPLGDIVDSIRVLLAGAPQIELLFTYICDGGKIEFSTAAVREILGEACDFANPELYEWVGKYLRQNLAEIKKEA